MHETDMTKALILTIREWLDEQARSPSRPFAEFSEQSSEQLENQASVKIEKVHLTVGEFTCVEPASLQFAFSAQTEDTFLEGVQLQIKEVPLVAFCHSCQQSYRPQIGLQYACPQCQSPMEDIRSGRELKIDRFEVISAESIEKTTETNRNNSVQGQARKGQARKGQIKAEQIKAEQNQTTPAKEKQFA